MRQSNIRFIKYLSDDKLKLLCESTHYPVPNVGDVLVNIRMSKDGLSKLSVALYITLRSTTNRSKIVQFEKLNDSGDRYFALTLDAALLNTQLEEDRELVSSWKPDILTFNDERPYASLNIVTYVQCPNCGRDLCSVNYISENTIHRCECGKWYKFSIADHSNIAVVYIDITADFDTQAHLEETIRPEEKDIHKVS